MYTIRIKQQSNTLFFLNLHNKTGSCVGAIGTCYRKRSIAKRWAKYWAKKLSFTYFEITFKDEINDN